MAPPKRQHQAAPDAALDLTIAPDSDDVRSLVFSAHITQLPSRNPALIQQLLQANEKGGPGSGGAGGGGSKTTSASPAGGKPGERPGTSDSQQQKEPFVAECSSVAVELYMPPSAFSAVGASINASRGIDASGASTTAATGSSSSSSKAHQQLPPLSPVDGGMATTICPGSIPSGWVLVGRSELPAAQQEAKSVVFQQRKLVVPAPNFVKDFLCSELLVAVVTSIPTPIDPAAAASNAAAATTTASKKIGSSSGASKNKNNSLADQIEFHGAVRTFTFNLGPSFSSTKSDLVSFSQQQGGVGGYDTLTASHDGPLLLNNSKISPRQDVLMQNSNPEIIPGIEKFTLRLESDGKLLAGRNVRRFPVAFFDIDSMNDVPPPAGTAIDLRAATLSNSTTNAPLSSGRGGALGGGALGGGAALSASVAAAARNAPPRVGFMWDGKLHLTQRAKWDSASNKWVFGYSRPLYAPYGTCAADGKSGAALQMIRHVNYSPVEFAIFDSESIADAASPTPTAPPTALARLSLRELVDGDIVCEATAAVLPERPEVSLALAEMSTHRAKVPHYVAHGTSLRCRVRLTTPLPFAVYVPPVPRPLAPSTVKGVIAPYANPDGTADAACFLSRIVLSLPYRSDLTRNVLRVVYALLMNYNKSGKQSDIFEVPALAPSPSSSPDDQQQQQPVAFAEDHFQSTLAILAGVESAPAQGSATTKGGGGGRSSARGAPSPAKGQQQQQLPQQTGPTEQEQAAIKAAHAVEDEEYVFHPFGNCDRRRVFVSVPDEVSGVEIIDGERRVVIIEGPCPLIAEVAELATDVAGPDLHSLRMLFNYELPFLRRDYHVWPPLVRPLAGQSQTAAMDRAANASRGSASGQDLDGGAAEQHGGKGAASPAPKHAAASSKQRAGAARGGGGRGGKHDKTGQPTPPPPEAKLTPRTAAAQSTKVVTTGATSIYGSGPLPLEPLPDLDPGALGGRLRRVRLNCTLQSVLRDPRAFLKRTLPPEAIDAATKLATLAGLQSLHAVHPPETMLDAYTRNCFPTTSSIVALERALGDCLSTEDVCCEGPDEWVPFQAGLDAEALARRLAQERLTNARALMREQQLVASHTRDMNAGRLPRVGTVLSFVGIPAAPKEAARFLPVDRVGEQYPTGRKSYMKVITASFLLESAETATTTNTSSGDRIICWPCVFPGPALSNQPIRFEVTGQVVPSRGPHMDAAPAILFVLDCRAYSATASDNRNPEFEKKKLRDKKTLAPKDYKKLVRASKKQQQMQAVEKTAQELEDEEARTQAASLRRPGCRPDSQTNVLAASGLYGCASDDDDDEGGTNEIDTPPRSALIGKNDNNNNSSLNNVQVQTDWHAKTLSDMRVRSERRAGEKQYEAMAQAARYQAAEELYQRQEEAKSRREAVIENLRSQQMQARPPFRSHQLAPAKEQNRHPKALEGGLGPRDRTPQKLAFRSDEPSDSSDDDDEHHHHASRHKTILPPMRFDRSVKPFDSSLGLGALNLETEDELEAQRLQRLQQQKERFNKAILVDDPVFHVATRKPREHPLQLDAIGSILEGQPKKKSIVKSFAPPPPISLREGRVYGTLGRVDPKQEKHPEARSFVYCQKNVVEPLPKQVVPVPQAARVGPLWGK